MPRNSSSPIWKLVEKCAHELTASGLTPFTRGDLIACVQHKNPDCGVNSINPIIQGITDNLRGGAPGAVGKDILHSVDRGRFELKSVGSASSTDPKVNSPPSPSSAKRSFHRAYRGQKTGVIIAEQKTSLGGYEFTYVSEIVPLMTDDGRVLDLYPQNRYKNSQNLSLNKYGKGPFCKFKIPSGFLESGVYTVTGNSGLCYIGECECLSDRFNMGYGNISPRNCFIGGQETNCRVNNLIYKEAVSGSRLALWFHQINDYKSVEASLRDAYRPPWNLV